MVLVQGRHSCFGRRAADFGLVGAAMTFDSQIEAALRYARPAVSRILRWHSADIEDALQNAAMKAWIHRADFQHRATFKSYFVRIAVNESLMLLRTKRRPIFNLDLAAHVPTDHESADATAIREQRARILLEEVARLRPKLRHQVHAFLNGTHTSTSTEKARLFRARHLLRPRLQQRNIGE